MSKCGYLIPTDSYLWCNEQITNGVIFVDSFKGDLYLPVALKVQAIDE